MPPGVSVATDGTVSGTPTTQGDYDPIVEATDSAGPPVSDTETFSFDIAAAPAGVTPIADVQGDNAATSPLDGQVVNVEGEVTASYPTGGLNGFYIQTPGPDTTPDASDAHLRLRRPGRVRDATYPAIGDSVSVTGTVGRVLRRDPDRGHRRRCRGHRRPSRLGGRQDPGPRHRLRPARHRVPGAPPRSTPPARRSRARPSSPTAPWTATDVYDGSPFVAGRSFTSSMFGEIGVAADSTLALVTPTEVIDAQAAAAKADRIAYNDAHRIILDDGSSTSYLTPRTPGCPFPWYTPTHNPRVGSAVTFPAPVILTYRLRHLADPAHKPGRRCADRHPAAVRADPGRQRGACERRW